MTDAASHRLARTLNRVVAATILAAGVAFVRSPCSAQESPAAAPASNAAPSSASQPAPAQDSASSGFQSQGIKATITSISLSDAKIILQFIIQNQRKSGVYLALIAGWGGSAGTLMATSGAVYRMDFPDSTISGLASCYQQGFSTTTDQNVAGCLEKFDEHNMTMVEAGQTAILGIIYDLDRSIGKPASPSDNVNFALKFIVRSAPAKGGTLSAAAAAGKAGPPSVVTISFPLIPLASQ